ncbi:MAG TPA: MBOAT family O-acyltransferase [Burkholderiaceae bacterium]
MVFSSATFLFYFLPIFLSLYYFLPTKNLVLLVASLIFYAWGEPAFVPILVFSALLNYSFGRWIASAKRHRRLLLSLGIAFNIGLLVKYKYAAFLAEALNEVILPWHVSIDVPRIILPLGISFFTFQGISYLIDVYRKEVSAQKSLLVFAMYKAMFPQLVAGPIVRYKQIADEIEHRVIGNERIGQGAKQFVAGLAQKVLIANAVGYCANRIFAIDAANLDAPTSWIGIACYTIQILYDFAGYSNMAIGIGHMIGFTYPPNFEQPYSSLSLTEFWRRWHISLSSWFRDYLYIPFGGNRVSPLRTYVNLALVFFLCGLWHGAAWTFVIWGCWHGAILILERSGFGRVLAKLPAPVAQAYTLFVVMLGWVFFRAPDLPYAFAYLQAMCGLHAATPATLPWQMALSTSAAAALAIGALLALVRQEQLAALGEWLMRKRIGGPVAFAATMAAYVFSVASLASGTYNPFIYFRF